LRAVDFSYKQSPLSHSDETQQQLLLILATRNIRSQLSQGDLAQLLEFIYVEVYPGGYSIDPIEDASYRELCARLKADMVRQLPPIANLLNYAQLVSQMKRGAMDPLKNSYRSY
jgi:hypothetical protein